jgi:enterochelin esterase-like enzyme
MKSKLIPLTIIAILFVGGIIALLTPQERQEATQQVSSGTLDYYPDFPSQHITARNVNVWLPNGYKKGDQCQVIYMHDGQMLFDATTTWNKQEWRVDEVMGELLATNSIPNTIVVAVDNTDNRLNEYFPNKTINYTPEEITTYGDMTPIGDDYLKFLVEELKPFIDQKYNPLTDREHTFVMGSSMGGLISIYALCEYPEVFGGAICMSTHISLGVLPLEGDNHTWGKAFEEYLNTNLPAANSHLVYMDRGTVGIDEPYAPYQMRADSLFAAKGWDDAHFTSLVFEGDEHNETCWANRLAQPLTFVLNK